MVVGIPYGSQLCGGGRKTRNQNQKLIDTTEDASVHGSTFFHTCLSLLTSNVVLQQICGVTGLKLLQRARMAVCA